MTTRLALILTGVWTLLVVAGCAGAITYIANGPQHQAEARASKAGGGFGVVTAIGYGAIWVPWAIVWSQKRKEQGRRRDDEDEDEVEEEVERKPRRRRKN
ncbi:MAG: hypothetical protein U0840_16225 [Gemmataceae bacterium]